MNGLFNCWFRKTRLLSAFVVVGAALCFYYIFAAQRIEYTTVNAETKRWGPTQN